MIIKYFRAQLDQRTFDTLRGYVDYFVGFMEGPRSAMLFPPEGQALAVSADVERLAQKIDKQITAEAQRLYREEKALDGEKVAGIVEETFRARVDAWSRAGFLEHRAEADAESVRSRYSDTIEHALGLLAAWPLSSHARASFHQLAGWLFAKKVRTHSEASGIVLAGFGERELFPQVTTIRVFGFENGRLLYEEAPDESGGITHDIRAEVIPFAQKDMIEAFMQGCENEHIAFLVSWLRRFLSKRLPDELPELLSGLSAEDISKVSAAVAGTTDGVVQKFRSEFSEVIHKRSIMPVIEMVQHLPKDELALMAESLVNLTSLKRRVSLGAETVGGPVDVAVISKGDGFVWTRRKHYFRPELNPHFIAGYLRDAVRFSSGKGEAEG